VPCKRNIIGPYLVPVRKENNNFEIPFKVRFLIIPYLICLIEEGTERL
jgi:hypothetical protein